MLYREAGDFNATYVEDSQTFPIQVLSDRDADRAAAPGCTQPLKRDITHITGTAIRMIGSANTIETDRKSTMPATVKAATARKMPSPGPMNSQSPDRPPASPKTSRNRQAESPSASRYEMPRLLGHEKHDDGTGDQERQQDDEKLTQQTG